MRDAAVVISRGEFSRRGDRGFFPAKFERFFIGIANGRYERENASTLVREIGLINQNGRSSPGLRGKKKPLCILPNASR